MCALKKPDDLSTLLKTGYSAPPPREEFVRDLAERMRKEFGEQRSAPAAPQPRRVSAIRWSWAWAAAAAAAVVLLTAGGITWTLTRPGDGPQAFPTPGSVAPPEPSGTPEEQMVPLDLKLPKALFIGTQKNFPPSPHLEPYSDKPRPRFMVPEGCVNLALSKPVTASEPITILGEPKQITDGCKEGDDGGYVELGPGTQWVQIDLGAEYALSAILVWHYHSQARVYRDVVVQVSNDKDFVSGVATIFNNDHDNTSGLGIGRDKEYIETNEGRLFDSRGAKGRYVRFSSNGNTSNDMNHYVEVEVYGLPSK